MISFLLSTIFLLITVAFGSSCDYRPAALWLLLIGTQVLCFIVALANFIGGVGA